MSRNDPRETGCRIGTGDKKTMPRKAWFFKAGFKRKKLHKSEFEFQ